MKDVDPTLRAANDRDAYQPPEWNCDFAIDV
jgi:hypothetical protein